MPHLLAIAHRGCSLVAPENTLSAFRAAVKLDIAGVELDYHHSADGVPVVIHDDTLDRTTNAVSLWKRQKNKVAEHSVAELKELDWGGWFDKGQFANESLPTLEAALDLICGAGKTCVIERKAGDATTLLNLLTRKKLIDQVVVMAFDWEFLERCHAIDSSLRLVALGDGPLTEEKLKAIAKIPTIFVNWDQTVLDRKVISQIHEFGMQAWTWTVNHAPRMRELRDAGIDAITTNDPSLLLEVLSGNS